MQEYAVVVDGKTIWVSAYDAQQAYQLVVEQLERAALLSLSNVVVYETKLVLAALAF